MGWGNGNLTSTAPNPAPWIRGLARLSARAAKKKFGCETVKIDLTDLNPRTYNEFRPEICRKDGANIVLFACFSGDSGSELEDTNPLNRSESA